MFDSLMQLLLYAIAATASLFGVSPGAGAVIFGLTLAILLVGFGVACIALSAAPVIESERAAVPASRKGRQP